MYSAVFLVICVIARVKSNQNLDTEQCRLYDENCLTRIADHVFSLAIEGVPSMKMKTLDPMHQDYIHGQVITADYKMINSTVVGFKSCHVTYTKLTLEKSKIEFKLSCPRVYMYGLYEISGRFIIVPVEGKGDYMLDTKDYHIDVETTTKFIQADDGRRYLQFKNFRALGDLRGGMVVHLSNLFNGQYNDLAEAALKFANDNWKPVAREFQGPTINANVKRIIKNINKYLKRVHLINS